MYDALASDAEVICEFMEPKPKDGSGLVAITPESRWWRYCYELDGGLSRSFLCPVMLDLDRLHEVKARLTKAQCEDYNRLLWDARETYTWHFSAEAKVAALANVLRKEATRCEPSNK